jgi:four helix bundle protein
VPAAQRISGAVTPAALALWPLHILHLTGQRGPVKEESMVLTADVPQAAGDAAFDFERFDVYRVAREFQQLVPGLVPRRGYAALRGQLDRASSSILLNIAEGCGRFSRPEKAQYYTIARGSAMECAAVLDVLSSRGLLSAAMHRDARGLLLRVTQMLTKLIPRLQ